MNEQDRENSVSPQEEYKIQKESEAYPNVGGQQTMNTNHYDPLAIYKKVDDQLNRSQYESDESKGRMLLQEDPGPAETNKESYNTTPGQG